MFWGSWADRFWAPSSLRKRSKRHQNTQGSCSAHTYITIVWSFDLYNSNLGDLPSDLTGCDDHECGNVTCSTEGLVGIEVGFLGMSLCSLPECRLSMGVEAKEDSRGATGRRVKEEAGV